MKNKMKKVIKLAFVAAFVAVAGYGIYANQTSDAISDLALANVDALAQGESGGGGSYCCAPYSIVCYYVLGGGVVYGLKLPLPC
jgi:hypothetical protein